MLAISVLNSLALFVVLSRTEGSDQNIQIKAWLEVQEGLRMLGRQDSSDSLMHCAIESMYTRSCADHVLLFAL